MHKLRRDELASLYPTAKTPNELHVERRRRELAQRPRQIELKLAAWTTGIVLVIKLTYVVLVHILDGSLGSEGAVITGVSVSFGVAMLAGAIVFYLYTLIRDLATRAFVDPRRLYMWLIGIVIVAGLAVLFSTALVCTVTVVVVFVVAYLTSRRLSVREHES